MVAFKNVAKRCLKHCVIPYMLVNAYFIQSEAESDLLVGLIHLVAVNMIALAVCAFYFVFTWLYFLAQEEKENEAKYTIALFKELKVHDHYPKVAKYHPLCDKLGMDTVIVSGDCIVISTYMLKHVTEDKKKIAKVPFFDFYFYITPERYPSVETLRAHVIDILERAYYGTFKDDVFKKSKYAEKKLGVTLKTFMDSFSNDQVVSPRDLTADMVVELFQ